MGRTIIVLSIVAVAAIAHPWAANAEPPSSVPPLSGTEPLPTTAPMSTDMSTEKTLPNQDHVVGEDLC